MEIINKNQLINEIKLFISVLESKPLERESLQWYLKNNLDDYLKDVEKVTNGNDLKIATKILNRFCLESMDWDTLLFKQCTRITELGLKTAKNI